MLEMNPWTMSPILDHAATQPRALLGSHGPLD